MIRRLGDYTSITPPSWLVKDLVPDSGFGLTHGQPGAGKTFLILTLLLSIGHGRDWHGYPTKGGFTVYVAGEGHRGVIQRSKAWHDYHGLDPSSAQVLIMEGPLQVLDEKAVKQFVEEVRAAAGAEPIRMVVLDTLSRCSAGGDENSQRDMSVFVARCDYIAKELGCFVMVLHHETKGGGTIRGSTTLPGAADLLLAVDRSGDGFTAEVTKQKDGKDGAVYQFALEPVEVGFDDDGEAVSVPVAVLEATSASRPKAPETIGKNQAALLDLLETAGPAGLTDEAWFFNAQALKVVGGMKPARAYREARDALLKAGRIRKNDDHFVTAKQAA
jgi:hypothetical protein